MACAAGTCKGLFTAPPGTVRNLPMIVKADQIGEYFIHLLGRYWPEGDPDAWNPISLTTPITVKSISSNPGDSSPTNQEKVAAVGQQGGQPGDSLISDGVTPWWFQPPAIIGYVCSVSW